MWNFLAPVMRLKALDESDESAVRVSLAKGTAHGAEVGYSRLDVARG